MECSSPLYKMAEQDRSKVVVSDSLWYPTLSWMTANGGQRSGLFGAAIGCAFQLRCTLSMPQSQECLELTQRMLCVTSVWKVKTLQWQLVTTNKKRKLGDGLFTEEPDAEEPCVQTVGSYLDRLFTLYSLCPGGIGVGGRCARSSRSRPCEVRGGAARHHVLLPRSKRVVSTLPGHKKLAWLQAHDQEEMRREQSGRGYRESTSWARS